MDNKQQNLHVNEHEIEQRIDNLRFELDQASVAQDAFINKLLASLEEPKEEKDVG